MRKIVTLFLTALLLSGCVVEWKSNREGPRWHDIVPTTPPPDVASATLGTP
jgi:hypothetical protein